MQIQPEKSATHMIVPATRGENPKTFCWPCAALERAEDEDDVDDGEKDEDDVDDDDCWSTSSKLSSSSEAAGDDEVEVVGASWHVAIPTTPMIVMIKKTTAALQLAEKVTEWDAWGGKEH